MKKQQMKIVNKIETKIGRKYFINTSERKIHTILLL